MHLKRIGQAFCLLFMVMGLAGIAIPASAHANLVRSEPPASAVLAAAPSQVRMWFSETPELSFSQVQVFDQNALQIFGVGQLKADPADNKLLSASLPPLPHGVFTVSWKAVSAVDGHVTAGGFAFVIGKEMVPAGGIRATLPGSATAISGPTPIGVSVRWLSYLSLAILIGGFAFAPLVFQPALDAVVKSRQGKNAPAVSPLQPGVSFSHDSGLFFALSWGWALSLCAAIAGAFVQAAVVGADIATLLTGTRFGTLFWLRIAVLVLIGGLLAYRQSRWWNRRLSTGWWWSAAALGLALALTISLGSHAAATVEPLLPVIGDWLHLSAMGVWLGGLLALLLTLLWLRRIGGGSKAATVAMLIGRFSQVATICLVVLGLTGALQILFEVGDLANLLDTPYGVTLLAKTSLILPLLGLAAINFFVIRRRMQQALNIADADAAIQPLQRLIRRTVTGEIVFVAAVLLITGILTSLPPGREAFGAGLVARTQAADLRLLVAVNPATPGLNTFDIYLKDDLNRPVPPVEKVALIFNMVEHQMLTTELVAQPATDAKDGHYIAQGSSMSMYGTWRIDLVVRRQGRDDVRATLTLPVRSTVIPPNAVVVATPTRLLLGIEILVLAVALYFGAGRLGRARRWAGVAGVVVSVIVALAGLGIGATGFAAGGTNNTGLIDPIPADLASVQRGQQIYQSNCAACHGTTGLGDGPVGANLNPPPANLRLHMAPSAGHTDGDLFDWITNGIPGSAMPAWGTQLSDNQRWDVINYIRTFGVNPLITPTPTP